MNILLITRKGEDLHLFECLQEDRTRPYYQPATLQVEVCESLTEAQRCLHSQDKSLIVIDRSLLDHRPSEIQMQLQPFAGRAPILLLSDDGDELPSDDGKVYDILPRPSLTPELLDRILPYIIERHRLFNALQESQKQIQRREAILQVISQEAERFLKTSDWQDCVAGFLRSLGEVTAASRVYIFQNEYLHGEGWFTSQQYEWVAQGITPQITNPLLQNVNYQDRFSRWVEEMSQHHAIQGEVRTFPESERQILEMQNILSIVAVPIFAGDIWWGFIGFDFCLPGYQWTPLEVPILRLAAGILGSAIQRQIAEQTIRDNANILRTMLNALSESFFLIDTQGKVLELNETGAKRMGVPIDELRGAYIWDFFSQEVIVRRKQMIQRVIDTRKPLSMLDERNGIWFQNYLYPIFNEAGEIIQIAVFAQDATQRVLAEKKLTQLNQELERRVEERTKRLMKEINYRRMIEESLLENERLFRNVVQDQTELVCRFKPDGTLTFVNIAYCMFYQKTVDQLINRPFWELLSRDTWQTVRQSLDSLTPDQPVGTIEHPVVTPDGQHHWLGWTNRAYFDEDGQVIEYQSTGQDLTARKKSEEELRRYTSRLETIEKVGSQLRLTEDPQSAMLLLAEQSAAAVQANISGICLFHNEEVEHALFYDGKLAHWEINRFNSYYPFIRSFENGQPQIVYRENVDPTFPLYRSLFSDGTVMLYLQPLQESQSTFGLLYLGFNPSKVFSTDEQYLLTTLAELGGITLKRIQTSRQLQAHMENRERELEVLYRISALSNELLDLSTVLQKSLQLVLEATGSQAGIIHLFGEDEDSPVQVLAVSPEMSEVFLEGKNQNNPKDLPYDQALTDHVLNIRSPIPTPIEEITGYAQWQARVHSKGKPLGLFLLYKEKSQQFSPEEQAFLNAVSDQLGVVIESSRLRNMLEKTAVDEERQRLARDLHDSVVQSLYGLLLFNHTAMEAAKMGNFKEIPNLLQKSAKMGEQALRELRLMLSELRPIPLEQDGLIPALDLRLDTVERRSNLDARIQVEGQIRRLPSKVETEIYRIAIEALNNVLRHAGASQIMVRLIFSSDQFELIIQDNGIGFDPRKRLVGEMGLKNMQERANQIHANFAVITAPGAGTQVKISLPLGIKTEELGGKDG